MNLVVDEGNTLVKLAVFQNDRMLEKQSFPKGEASEKIKKIFQDHPDITNSILSSVGAGESVLEKELVNLAPLLRLDKTTRLPYSNNYTTPDSLGKDRIALTAGAVHKYPGRNVLVIDAGTCITYDLKTDKEVYLGGAISPGMRMRFNSLHKFTAKLPLVSPQRDPELIGNSTQNSILSGVINGIRMELNGQIAAYKAEFDGLIVIFTGGDSQFLSIPLKNSIFANSNFLLEGLNFILEFNITQ